MNDKNLDFYKNMDVSHMQEHAQKGGFSTYKDLELIFPHIKDSHKILEVGAGYGRCIDFLLQKKFKGTVYAIEGSGGFFNHLKKEYSALPGVQLLEGDVKTMDLPVNLDAALWMWSGFIDFSKEQQSDCLKKIHQSLNPGGKVIIDVPRLGIPTTIGRHQDDKNLFFDTPYGTLTCYIPDHSEMEEYRREGGYKNLETIDYTTATDKERTIYILTK